MLLTGKVAVVYGGGGTIGGAMARGFAREGARVFLAGRTVATLDRVAEEIRAAGGAAETATVDAQDESTVAEFVASVAARAGRIDISANVIGYGDVQRPLLEITVDEFLRPIVTAMRSQFLTTRAAADYMVTQGGGVVLAFGGGGPQTLPGLGGFKVTLDAVESLRRQWACELGRQGIRVVTLKSGGVPESIPADLADREAITAELERATGLGRLATLADVARVAAFAASDQARTITDTEINISCGAYPD